jgi:hypothetical protein
LADTLSGTAALRDAGASRSRCGLLNGVRCCRVGDKTDHLSVLPSALQAERLGSHKRKTPMSYRLLVFGFIEPRTNEKSRRRRGGDSNPRTGSTPVTRFPVAPIQPLWHLSILGAACAALLEGYDTDGLPANRGPLHAQNRPSEGREATSMALRPDFSGPSLVPLVGFLRTPRSRARGTPQNETHATALAPAAGTSQDPHTRTPVILSSPTTRRPRCFSPQAQPSARTSG